jgi:DNA polymerase-3 subunit alpha
MTSPNFVHLHLHTDYSLLDGACDVSEVLDETARRGMPAVAVTDHGNLFAAANFYHEATKRGVKPIIGCEVYVAPDGHTARGGDVERSNHLVLLCENDEGYRNLIKLVSTGYLEGFYYKPRVDHDLLAKHSGGLIALSACLRGEVTDHVLAERTEQARNAAGRLQEIFGKGNFFLEVQDQDLDVDKRVNRDLVALSRSTGIPVVATNDCHYLTREDAHAQEVLLCIQTGKTMGDSSRMRFATEQFYFKTAEEMAQVFRELPEALERTVAIAERCKLKMERVKNPFPEFAVPEGHTAESYFEKVVRDGFAARVPQLEEMQGRGTLLKPLVAYEERLSAEIEMIKQMRYAGYFLIVWDFIRYARAQGVPVGPGRGSAAGSLVSYSLHITDVDPLQYGLFFERFLNPERISMPDIDIDFCMRRRGEVIEYVRGKYGSANVAQIITFGTMAAKAALKDVGRALDMPYGEVDRLAKLVPNQLNITLDKALKESPQMEAARQRDPRVKEVVEIALRLEGMARHASTHAAGVVISPQPLTDIVPLYKSNRDEVMTQYDMNALERLGLLKMDFLGLTTLTVLNDAVRMIQQNRGVEIDLAKLPLDDQPTYALFGRADTTAIFQFESQGMRDILRRYQPTRLEDLTALNALYRPGPIQGGMIDDFIARKLGRKKVAYDLPELKEILEETLGVIIYQEHVMQIANRLAGFTLGEADILRRAMGKKKPEEMAAQRQKFLAGCQARKVPAKKAERIFDLMEEFAGYGFPKAHSCAYALLAYQTAYLKVHYPVEFMAALLTCETGKNDKVVKYIHEARGMGITVLPPDVNTSDVDFTPVGDAIRFGLRSVKNVGENTVRGILQVREKLGRFRTLFEFCDNVDNRLLNRRVLESLIRSGAMDGLGVHRAQLMAVLDSAMERSQRMQHAESIGQHGLFGGKAAQPSPAPPMPEVEAWPEHELLANEFATVGFYISGHPVDKYAGRLQEMGVTDLVSLEERGDGADVILAGIIVQARVARSRRGAKWGSYTLQDRTGLAELLVFSETFARLESLFAENIPLLIKGRITVEDREGQETGRTLRVRVEDARPLEKMVQDGPGTLRIRIELASLGNGELDRLRDIFLRQPGRCRVVFDLIEPGGDAATVEASSSVKADETLLFAVRQIFGDQAVVVD